MMETFLALSFFMGPHSYLRQDIPSSEMCIEYDYDLLFLGAAQNQKRRIKMVFYVGSDRSLCTIDGTPIMQWSRTSREMRSPDVSTVSESGTRMIFFDYAVLGDIPKNPIIIDDAILVSIAEMSPQSVGISRARDLVEGQRDTARLASIDQRKRREYTVTACKFIKGSDQLAGLELHYGKGVRTVHASVKLKVNGRINVSYVDFRPSSARPKPYKDYILSQVSWFGLE